MLELCGPWLFRLFTGRVKEWGIESTFGVLFSGTFSHIETAIRVRTGAMVGGASVERRSTPKKHVFVHVLCAGNLQSPTDFHFRVPL